MIYFVKAASNMAEVIFTQSRHAMKDRIIFQRERVFRPTCIQVPAAETIQGRQTRVACEQQTKCTVAQELLITLCTILSDSREAKF